MVFSLLGTIRIGDSSWTSPTAISESRSAELPELDVARGKKPVQDMGDNNDRKDLEFFFDETFCEPRSELAMLDAAFAARTPLPLVGGDGAFNGVRWLIESYEVATLKATRTGRPVRIRVKAKLKEAPVADLLGLATQMALAGATGLVGAATVTAFK